MYLVFPDVVPEVSAKTGNRARPGDVLQAREGGLPVLVPELFVEADGDAGLEVADALDRGEVVIAAEAGVRRASDEAKQLSRWVAAGSCRASRPAR